MVLVCAAPALKAQDAVSPAPVTAAAVADPNVLPTVTVTAEKLGRSLMDTGTSAVVLDQHELETRAGLSSLKDVLASVPNVVYVGTGNIAPAIRGVDSTGASQGSDAFIAGSRSRLNVQIDGRPASYNEVVFGDGEVWDIQQIEVLRGAQSTLQGRNAIAGTIAVKTNDPSFENEGAVRVSGGNFEQRRASAMLSGPLLSDGLAYRLSADWFSKESFVQGYQGFPSVNDPGDFEALDLRGKLLFEPKALPDLRSLLTLNYADYRGPQVESTSRASGFRDASTPTMPVFEPRSGSLISDSTYRLNDALDLEALLSGTDLKVQRKAVAGQGTADIEGGEYVVEPRLRWHGAGRATGVVGVYLYSDDQDETLDFFDLAFKDHVRTAAIFGEATLPFNSVLDLVAGGRYEEEHHQRHGGNGSSVEVNLDETYRAFLPKIGLSWHVQPKTTLGVQASRGYNGGGAGAAFDDQLSQITNYQYSPEYVWTYEAYGRQELAGGRVRLTANVFYASYRDMQLTFDLTPTDPSDFEFVVRNANRVKTWGGEFGGTWLVLHGLELYGSFGVLKARITDYPGSGYQGNQLPNAPAFSGSAGGTWRRSHWDANFNARYSESYYSDVANQPRGKVAPYWIANAQAGYTWRQLRVFGAVDNLFDSNAQLAIYSGATPDQDTANPMRPRTYRFGLQYTY